MLSLRGIKGMVLKRKSKKELKLEYDKDKRERLCKYTHINLLLFPEFYLFKNTINMDRTVADIHSTETNEIIGELFLRWHSSEIEITCDKNVFSNAVERLKDGGYTVKFENVAEQTCK